MKPMPPDDTARCVMFVIDVADLDGDIEEQRAWLAIRLARYASIKRWAFVLHDRDEQAPHWQGILATEKNYTGRVFAERLGIESVYKLTGGERAVIGGLRYLTHEEDPTKAQYPRSSITAVDGWEWEAALDAAALNDAGRGNAGRKKLLASVQDGAISALDAVRRGAGNERAIRVARARFLSGVGSEDLPGVRVNFYLQGTAHPSLDRLAQALARTLSTDGRFYEFNGREVDEYDGEDVVLMQAILRAWGSEVVDGWFEITGDGPLGGPRELFSMLSATPSPHTLMTRYGKTQLVHRHTVIVGEQPFERFRGQLEQLYQQVVDNSRDQAELSLPVIVPVDAESFRIQISSRFVLGRGELGQYVESESYRLAIGAALAAARTVPGEQRAALVRQLEQQQTAAIREAGAAVARSLRPADQAAADVIAAFPDLGRPIVAGHLA